MKRISMMKAIRICHKYEKMPALQRQVLQRERLRELVINAKENSPYFSKLYADIPDDFSLSDLPATNKRDLMEHWNDWVTDRSVTLEQVNEFMQNKDNIGRKWRKKYMVVYANGGFFLGNSTIRSKLLMMPWKKHQFGISSALYPTEKIVEQLNRFQPAMLGGYPSNLELLIEEQKSGHFLCMYGRRYSCL